MNPAQFSSWYARNWDSLVRYARGLCRNLHTAEDIVQQAWLRQSRRCDRLADENHAAASTFLVITRLTIDHARSGSTRKERSAPDLENYYKTDSGSESELLEMTEDPADVERELRKKDTQAKKIIGELFGGTKGVEKMTREQGEALQLWLACGCNRIDAACVSGISQSAFDGRLHRAKDNTRSAISRHSEFFLEYPQTRFLRILADELSERS